MSLESPPGFLTKRRDCFDFATLVFNEFKFSCNEFELGFAYPTNGFQLAFIFNFNKCFFWLQHENDYDYFFLVILLFWVLLLNIIS